MPKKIKIRKKKKYDIDVEPETSPVVDDTEQRNKQIDELLKIKQLDEDSPMERAIKMDKVKKYPAKPGFMKVSVSEGKDDDGNRFVVSESEDEKGKKTVMVHDPFRVVDLKTSIDADVSRAPCHVMPMLIDEYSEMVAMEKKEFKPEKRKEPFKYWWVLLLLLMLPGIILIIFMFI